MRNIIHILCCCLILLSITFNAHAHSLKHSPHHKWRIIYVEGGNYEEYHSTLLSLIKGLMQLDLIKSIPIPSGDTFTSTQEIWDWIIKNTESNVLEFIPDGYYSANWSTKKRITQKQNILNRIQGQNDIDIILAFGTFAGTDFATNEHTIPTFVMAVTDSVEANIIKSVDDSGLDHVHASIETGRYERQLATFYDIFKFKKLGIPFDNSKDGKITIAYKQLENASQKLGFEIELCNFNSLDTQDNVRKNLITCLQDLSQRSDAIYLTMNTGMQWNKMTEILQPIISAGIPTFSQLGVKETELGVLMSLSQPSFDNEGINTAKAIENTIQGKLPRESQQEFSGPLGLAINLKMAMLIGWNPPFEILAAVDNIYHDIKNEIK